MEEGTIFLPPPPFHPHPYHPQTNKQAKKEETARKNLPPLPQKQLHQHTSKKTTIPQTLTTAITWLIENPTQLEQMEWIANQMGETAETLLTKYGPKYRRLAHHLWCDILAALSSTLNQALTATDLLIRRTADVVADQVYDLVMAGRNNRAGNIPTRGQTLMEKITGPLIPGREHLNEAILKQAIKTFIEKLLQKFILEPRTAVEALLLQIRLLALILCPAPEDHRTVWNNCAVPLVGDQVASKSLEEIDKLKQSIEQQGKSILSSL